MKQKILDFFYELCKIPRRSGNEAAVCAWLCAFAGERGLDYSTDELHNVVIRKPAANGGTGETVVLQGHTDMVCAAAPESVFHPEFDGVIPVLEGDILRAEGTTLGADNGIAVATMLAILDADDLRHPPLECVFTTQEETGLFGAKAIDPALISGRTMINLDSEEEGVATVSCAGGKRLRLELQSELRIGRGYTLTISIDGLRGGHSGTDIGLERQNAIKLLGEALNEAGGDIAMLDGGEADNAIPRSASATLLFADAASQKAAEEALNTWAEEAVADLNAREPGLSIEISAAAVPTDEQLCLPAEAGNALRRLLAVLPWGVRARNPEAGGFIVASENVGVIGLEDDGSLHLVSSLRSSDPRWMRVMSREIETLAAAFGFSCTAGSEYPGWSYAPQSRIRDVMSTVYRELFGKDLRIEAIHAGLECGIFCEKLPGLDAIAIGPDITGCHTPEERLNVSSAERVAKLVCAVLERLS